MKQFLKSNALILGILVMALVFRFWQIGSLPGGLFPDEAANGLDVNSILHGNLQPFYERGNGREGLFFYFLAFSVALFGRGPWQHHIVSAAFGFFAVVATYFLTKRLFGKNIALLATFFMATSSFATTLSRTAFRATIIPFFSTLTLFLLTKFFQEKNANTKTRLAVYTGVTFALGFYTYIAYRMMIPLLVVLFSILAFAYRDQAKIFWESHKKYFSLLIGSFIIAFAPLGYYFFVHPGALVGRAGQVSIFSKDLNHGDAVGTFLAVFKKTILGFFTEGDLNWRHNISGFPFLSPFLSLFFAIGLIIFTVSIFSFLKDAWQKSINFPTVSKALVAIWFWLMLAPEITTAEGIPHGLRLVGVIPAIFIIPAWSINKIWEMLKTQKKLAIPSSLALGIILGSILTYNFYLYFYVTANSPENYYAFRSDLTSVSNYLNQRNLKENTFLSLDKFSVQTVDYLTTENDQPYILLDPAHTFEVGLKPGDEVIFTQSTLFDRLKFENYHPETKLVKTEKNKFGEIIMLVYEAS